MHTSLNPLRYFNPDRPPIRITIHSAFNRVFKHWAEIFNNDSALTSALLDRLLHHAETVLIEGKSYRMKDQIDNLKN
jgi:DNA replication protein DnaC